jgi:predicted transcriptional regulator of viral defense system
MSVLTRLSVVHKREIIKRLLVPVRYQELKPLLLSYMDETPYKRLPSFENALSRDGLLNSHVLSAESGQETRMYSSLAPGKWNPYQVAQSLFPSGYFCNLTSIYFHELINQVPSRIYVAVELNRQKDQRQGKAVILSDHAIFEAFVRPHRGSKHNYKFYKHIITLTERVWRNCVGVESIKEKVHICPRNSRVTSLERMLIDAIVQPQYNGGLLAVIDVYRKGLSKVNTSKMLDVLDKLDYVYPYWQAIGFLCDRIGFEGIAADILKKYRPKNIFYLDHNAKTSWEFDDKWKIYYPKGVL